MGNSEQLTESFVSDLTNSQARLFAYILSLLRNSEEARDVLQETNLVLWKKLEEYSEIVSFEAWSTKVAYFKFWHIDEIEAVIGTTLMTSY